MFFFSANFKSLNSNLGKTFFVVYILVIELLLDVLSKGTFFFFRSGLLDLIHTWNKDVGQFYEDRINEQKKAYSERQDTFILFDLLLLSIMNI